MIAAGGLLFAKDGLRPNMTGDRRSLIGQKQPLIQHAARTIALDFASKNLRRATFFGNFKRQTMPLTPPFRVNLRSYAAESDEHTHSFSQLVLPVAGKLQINIGGRDGYLQQGRAAFVASGTRHSQAGQGENRFLVVDLGDGEITGAFDERMHARPFVTVSPAAYRLMGYMELALHGGTTRAAVAQHWVPLMLDALSGESARPASRLTALMARVESDPGQRWTTESMAREVCVSVSRLHPLFRAELDTTPAAWLSQVRLARVREWLVQTNRPIAEIALAAGYADQNALTRAMSKATGITPAALRKQAKDSA